MLECVATEAAQPIVRMNDVGAAVCLDVGKHASGELGNDVDHVAFWHIDCTCRDMNHLVIRLDKNFCGKAFAPCTRICGAVDACVGQSRNQFAHIDVHSPTVTNSGLGEWRSMKRKDGYTTHAVLNLSSVVLIPLTGLFPGNGAAHK